MTQNEFDALTIEDRIDISCDRSPWVLGIQEIYRGTGDIKHEWNGTVHFTECKCVADQAGG